MLPSGQKGAVNNKEQTLELHFYTTAINITPKERSETELH